MRGSRVRIVVTAGLAAALTVGTVPAWGTEAIESGAAADWVATTDSRALPIPGLPEEGVAGQSYYDVSPSGFCDASVNEDGVTEYSVNAVEGFLSELPSVNVNEYKWTEGYTDNTGIYHEASWLWNRHLKLDAAWTISGEEIDFDELTAGTYTAIGTVQSDDPDIAGLTCELIINIVEADQVAVAHWDAGPYTALTTTAPEDREPPYPTMSCTLYDGTILSLPVEWEEVDPSLFKKPGNVHIDGVIQGTDVEVYVDYVVYTPLGIGEVSSGWTFVGVQYLADNVSVTIEVEGPNGTEEINPNASGAQIIWGNNEAITYDEPGIYELSGTVELGDGTTYPVETEVQVFALPDDISDFEWSDQDNDTMSVWTTPGTAPQIPQYIWAKTPDGVTSSNGYTVQFDIDWEEIDPSLYAEDKVNTSFTVTGKVSISDALSSAADTTLPGVEATCTVYVADAEIEFVPEITTMLGVAPEIPNQVTVTSSDGRTHVYRVLYLTIPEELYTKPGNTFTVDATLVENNYGNYFYGNVLYREITVHVADVPATPADDAAMADQLQLACTAGNVPALPETLPVVLSDGSTVPAAVQWEDVDDTKFAKEGDVVDVIGTIQNVEDLPEEAQIALAATGNTVTAKVTVVDADSSVVSFVEPEYAFVEVGSKADVNDSTFGHSSVTAVKSDGSKVDYDVTWDTDGLNLDEPGSYLLTGTSDASDDVTAYLYVNVVDSDAPETPDEPDEPTDPEQPGDSDTDEPTTPSQPSGDEEFQIEAPEVEGGTVELSDASAAAGDTVTITLTPDEGKEVRGVVVTDAEGQQIDLVQNEDGTYSFTMPEGEVSVDVTFGCDGGELCASHEFADLDHSLWYHDAVDWAVSNGAMNGYANGLFGPDDSLLREQAAAVLWNYLGAGDDSASAAELDDVERGAWYSVAVNWAVENGIMNGYDDGSGFGVGDSLTREQFAAVIANAVGADVESVDPAVLDGFTDGDEVSDWARQCMTWAVDAGVLNGVDLGDGTRKLDATREISRAEMAAMMMNAVEAGVLVR